MKSATMSSIKTMTNSEKRIQAHGKISQDGFCSWSLVIAIVLCPQNVHANIIQFTMANVGILTGLVACTVDIVIERLSAVKYGFLKICKYNL